MYMKGEIPNVKIKRTKKENTEEQAKKERKLERSI